MSGQPNSLDSILCAHLLRRVDEKLIDLLRSLEPGEWDLQTVAPLWKVRDVAAHLLDATLRKLSMVRDSCYVETVNISSFQDVIALVNRLNRQGVTVYRRLSPPVLIDMMKMACEQSARFHESLDPFARAAFAVTWAGEESSLNWFDTARELTERWHHRQQIRLAGVVVCRGSEANGWSAPSTVRIEGGSVGLQIGAGETDVVFIVMNQRGMDKLMRDKFTVGADASAMAGPLVPTCKSSRKPLPYGRGSERLAEPRVSKRFGGIAERELLQVGTRPV